MKISFYLSLALFILCGAQNTSAQLTGTFSEAPEKKRTLSNNDGLSIPVNADQNGNYQIGIKQLKKGIYTLTDVGDIYLEPNYTLTIKKVNKIYEFIGKGSLENNQLRQIETPLEWMKSNNGYGIPLSVFLIEPAIFISKMDKYQKETTASISESKNQFFKDLVSKEINYIRLNNIYNWKLFYGMDSTRMDSLKKMLAVPLALRTKDHAKKQYQAYLHQFSKKMSDEEKKQVNDMLFSGWDMNNELLFKNSSSYKQAIVYRLNFEVSSGPYKKLSDSLKNPELAKLSFIKNEINNPYIKDHLLYNATLSLIKKSKNSDKVTGPYNDYVKNNKNLSHLKAIEQAFKNLKETEKNGIAPDFSYANQENKLISLKSMRGNYVYIDLWATWCAPCVAEIPDLKKLELAMKDKKIKFVSISLDPQNDKNKWLNYVKDNELQGVQLIADNDFKSEFVQKFGVNSIPRFLLISPDGIVLDNDAKRPSNPELQKQLEMLLK